MTEEEKQVQAVFKAFQASIDELPSTRAKIDLAYNVAKYTLGAGVADKAKANDGKTGLLPMVDEFARVCAEFAVRIGELPDVAFDYVSSGLVNEIAEELKKKEVAA